LVTQPRVHAILADKRNLALWSTPQTLLDWGLTLADADCLEDAVPCAGVVAAGFVQSPGGLQVWLGPFFQAAVAGQAEQEIGVRIVERQLHQFHVGKMGITAQQDVGLGSVLAQPLEHPLDDHRVLCALRAFARSQRGGDELARQAFKQKQGQVAVALVMVIVKRSSCWPWVRSSE